MTHTLSVLMVLIALADDAAAQVQAPPTAAVDQPVSTQPAADSADEVGPVPPEGWVAEQWLRRAEAAAGQLEGFTARVRYRSVQGLLGDEQTRFGDMAYVPPDDETGIGPKVRIEFDGLLIDGGLRTIEQSFVFDGRWLLEVDRQQRTATRREVARRGERVRLSIGEGPVPIPLDLEAAEVLERFEVQLLDPAEGDPDDAVHLLLLPRDDVPGRADRPEVNRIDLWLDRQTALPVRAATLEPDEDQQIVDLVEPDPHATPGPDAFDTSPPRGGGWDVQVVPLEG
jgi:hypothetical protein